MQRQALLTRAISFVLAAALGFGAMAQAEILGGPSPQSDLAAQSSHDLHEALGGNHKGKLVAVRDDRTELSRSDAMHVQIENHFGQPATMLFAVELVDELGNEASGPRTSRTHSLASDETFEVDLRVPRNLADGFYLFRVTAAGRSGHETADAGAELGFVLAGDAIQLLSEEDWMQFSFANEGEEQ